MRLYVIYEDPPDRPGVFVVRVWELGPGTDQFSVTVPFSTPNLAFARKSIPEGMVKIFGEDDPTRKYRGVREIWAQ